MAADPGQGGAGHVTILMALHEGAAHLPAQFASLLSQTHRDWSLVAGVDGTSDGTLAMLRDLAARHPGRVRRLTRGPRRGAAAHFMALLRDLGPAPGHVAFADQDDVWLPDRLARGLAGLARFGAEPAMACAPTIVVDARLRGGQPSAAPCRPLGFRNALVQNVAAGNTILLNPAAAALAVAAAAEAGAVTLHDWWLYQLVTGAGGHVAFDDVPALLYRQHGTNVIGANLGLRARARRLRWMLDGTWARWNAANRAALVASAHRLTPEARATLAGFADLPGLSGPLARLRALFRLGLYRQTTRASAALWLAAALRRM
ncbi:MAG TPA: glycosyltransferase [Paracoccaceae bacterium]|nr:glycosyltransferase [Paracoccaceae bacterium]